MFVLVDPLDLNRMSTVRTDTERSFLLVVLARQWNTNVLEGGIQKDLNGTRPQKPNKLNLLAFPSRRQRQRCRDACPFLAFQYDKGRISIPVGGLSIGSFLGLDCRDKCPRVALHSQLVIGL